jgi:hypothetical protein
VKKAGLNPIPPIAKDAEVIQAVIIENLEKADLVLCDMSSLNANVFFELGIRTAIGKPACMVKDDLTQKVPFDMGVVNYQEYASGLNSWAVPAQIEKLASHIKSTADNSKGQNMLWKYFSMTERARLNAPKDDTQSRLELIAMQVEGLNRKVDTLASKPPQDARALTLEGLTGIAPQQIATWPPPSIEANELQRILHELLRVSRGAIHSIHNNPPGFVTIGAERALTAEEESAVNMICSQYGRAPMVSVYPRPLGGKSTTG